MTGGNARTAALMLMGGAVASPAGAATYVYNILPTSENPVFITLDGAATEQFAYGVLSGGSNPYVFVGQNDNVVAKNLLPGPALPTAADFTDSGFATVIKTGNGPSYLGLRFTADGATRYGTASFGDDATLLSITTGAAVPEPAVWVELVTGFALAGAGLRAARRRRTVAA